MIMNVICSAWFYGPFAYLIFYSVIESLLWRKTGHKSQSYSLKMIRESISYGITVIGIFIVGLASLVIWLKENYSDGPTNAAIPIVCSIVFFSFALFIGMSLLYASATQFESSEKFTASYGTHSSFIIWFGIAANLVLVGILVLIVYFAFAFDFSKLRLGSDDRASGKSSYVIPRCAVKIPINDATNVELKDNSLAHTMPNAAES